ncbi:DUF423 domain-containing protein [Roseomonas stagni]|uniref:DUF423 domain-containing protein n=1 Tax=Falsiroseomonas algicola TaxID=2716930 RepID=A0A6M1LL76_9PROT|nr:DUF423 domain-containing protein [Falsiroseomonas algicola]NGM21086.1 DUF423 domain-containing protein [Falsiroseomonas algicola]
MARMWMVFGALSGLIAVAMAAYASHGLAPERAALATTGASLQAWHALALLGAGLLAERRRGRLVHIAAGCFAAGTIAFCGGVYLRALTDTSLGLVTPLGGTVLLVGWGILAAAAALAPQK